MNRYEWNGQQFKPVRDQDSLTAKSHNEKEQEANHARDAHIETQSRVRSSESPLNENHNKSVSTFTSLAAAGDAVGDSAHSAEGIAGSPQSSALIGVPSDISAGQSAEDQEPRMLAHAGEISLMQPMMETIPPTGDPQGSLRSQPANWKGGMHQQQSSESGNSLAKRLSGAKDKDGGDPVHSSQARGRAEVATQAKRMTDAPENCHKPSALGSAATRAQSGCASGCASQAVRTREVPAASESTPASAASMSLSVANSTRKDPPESARLASAESELLRQSAAQSEESVEVRPGAQRFDSVKWSDNLPQSTVSGSNPATLPLSYSDFRGESMEAIRAQHPESSPKYCYLCGRIEESPADCKWIEMQKQLKEDTKLTAKANVDGKELTYDESEKKWKGEGVELSVSKECAGPYDGCGNAHHIDEPKETEQRKRKMEPEVAAMNDITKAHERRDKRIRQLENSHAGKRGAINKECNETVEGIIASLPEPMAGRVEQWAHEKYNKPQEG